MIKNFFLAISFIFVFGCATEIVYVDKLIRPEIPKLVTLSRPDISKLSFDIVDQNGLQLYCTDADGIDFVRSNQWKLQQTIKSYEEMIKTYNKFYADYEQKRTAIEK